MDQTSRTTTRWHTVLWTENLSSVIYQGKALTITSMQMINCLMKKHHSDLQKSLIKSTSKCPLEELCKIALQQRSDTL